MSNATELRGRSCLDRCEGHRPFSLDAGDRAKRTRDEAVALAEKREVTRGQQVVSQHFGTIFRRGVYFIQDAERPA